ncbi:unnamed protein product, partial [Medioppia subpectinata]
ELVSGVKLATRYIHNVITHKPVLPWPLSSLPITTSYEPSFPTVAERSRILNKITPEKFKKLSKELLAVGLDSPAILKGLILLIFDKALEEPKYSCMYAQLCRIISEEAPNFESNRDHTNVGPLNKTFCRLLLAKCQDEFENRRRASEAFDNRDGPLTAVEEEQRSVAKHKMLGNIKFICELGKQNLLQESILHLCIRQLLSKQTRDQSIQEKAQDLECLTQIMKTVGRLLDNERAKSLMNQYIERIEYYSTHNELSSRIRFMLQDVLELRRNNWAPRRVQREAGPKTILQIREEAAFLMPQINGGLQLGTGPGAINDAYHPNHNVSHLGRRNQNNNYNNQYQNHAKRDQMNTRQQQQQQQPTNASPPTVNSTGGREVPPRFQKLQQPAVAITNTSINANQIQPQSVPLKPLASMAAQSHGFDSSGISLRPAINSMVSKPNIPLTKQSSNKDYGVYLPPHQYTFGPLSSRVLKPGQREEDFLMPQMAYNAYSLGLQLGTGPGAINDAYHHNVSHLGRRNQNNNYNNQYQNHAKRDQMNARQQQQQQPTNASPPTVNNSTGGRELPPRFQKLQQPAVAITNTSINANQIQPQSAPLKPLASMAAQSHGFDSSGISLRPAINSMVSKPNIPLTKQSSTNINNIKNNNANNIMNEFSKTVETIIEKPNINKNANQSNKEAILKKTEDTLQEFLSENQNIDDVIIKFKEMKIPKNFQLDVLVTILKKSLEASESERETSTKLLNQLKAEDVIGANIFMNAFKDLINRIEDLETYIPRVKSNVAAFMSSAIVDNVVTLKEASEPLEGGQHYPLFMLCLQHLHKTKGNAWLFNAFTESKINLIQMLPENDRNKERLADILEDRALGFLYPMLRIESDLWKQLTHNDCTPTSLYRWLKDNVDPSLQNSCEFIRVLFTALLKYINNEVSKLSITDTDSQTQTQTNGTNITDNERQILTKFEHLLKAFLNEKHSLQLIALYALQSYCFGLNFPKGMLLRWFLMLYDLEVIEEEVFIKWKEDINDEYPGKGKALFQVNQWLTWLEEAEEEEEEEDTEQILN